LGDSSPDGYYLAGAVGTGHAWHGEARIIKAFYDHEVPVIQRDSVDVHKHLTRSGLERIFLYQNE
jgi:hypothetical protein